MQPLQSEATISDIASGGNTYCGIKHKEGHQEQGSLKCSSEVCFLEVVAWRGEKQLEIAVELRLIQSLVRSILGMESSLFTGREQVISFRIRTHDSQFLLIDSTLVYKG